jgi:hypothetical protein
MPDGGRAPGAGQADWPPTVAAADQDRVLADETAAGCLAELRRPNGGRADARARTGQQPGEAVPVGRGAPRTRCWQR